MSGNTYLRTPTVAATAGGVITAAHTAVGMDLGISEASYTVATAGGTAYDPGFLAPVTLTIAGQDWVGYVTQVEPGYYPGTVVAHCRGPLILAQLTTMNAYASGGSTTGVGGKLLVPADGSGAHDEDIIAALLANCGITASGGSGSGRLLGTIAPQQFRWAEGESGLSVIQRLDECCVAEDGGKWLFLRTYDTPSGTVVRTTIDPAPATATYDFTEGVDIWRGSGAADILQTKNKAVVTGYDGGGGNGAINYTLTESNIYLPSGVDVAVQVSSSMIEVQTEADVVGSNGLSCEGVVNALLYAWNRTQRRATFTTPLNAAVQVGDTINIITPSTTPERLGMVSAAWVQRVERDIAEDGALSVILTVIQGANS